VLRIKDLGEDKVESSQSRQDRDLSERVGIFDRLKVERESGGGKKKEEM
jgi:hypothetical protein